MVSFLKFAQQVIVNSDRKQGTKDNMLGTVATLQDNGSILQINAVDDSVASMIKAKRGTQYEYPVEEVKSPIPLRCV